MKILDPSIKGHNTIQNNLFSAVAQNRLPHALLFYGPSGVGKKQMAFALAQTLLCKKSQPACGKCPCCQKIKENPSVLLISPETLQIRIHEVEKITPFLSLKSEAAAQIVMIEEAHQLNIQAANFLLKIIEEPPLNSYFFLISSLPSRLPPTLVSRLQKIRFQPLTESILKAISPGAKAWMTQAAQGRMDRLQEFQDKSQLRQFAFELWDKMLETTNPLAFSFPLEIKDRKTALFIIQCWQQLLRDGRFSQTGEKDISLIHADKKELIKKISLFPKGKLDVLIENALELERNINAYRDVVLCFEHFALSIHDL